MTRLSVVFVFMLSASLSLAGQRPASSAETEPPNTESRAIRAAAKAYFEALQNGDADAALALWTPDGKYSDGSGRSIPAADLIRQELSVAAAQQGAQDLDLRVGAIRLLSPEVAVEDGIVDAAPGDADSREKGRYTAIWVKRDGRWLLDSVRDSHLVAASNRAHLAALDWMVGNWRGTQGNVTVDLAVRWSENQNYLIRHFEVADGTGGRLQGTQRIGWDPAAGEIRCWTFDSDGAFNSGFWHRDGDSWIVQLSGVSQDGQTTEATHVWERTEPDRSTVTTIENRLGDELLPPATLELVRLGSDNRE